MRPLRRRGARIGALVALVVLCVVAIVAATRPSFQASEVESPLLGHRAPSIAASGLTGGNASLAADRGHWVVINFFASWCPPCQAEVPALVGFAFHHPDDRLISVVFKDSDTDAANFVRTDGVEWPVVADPGGNIALNYGVTSPPVTFIVNPQGVVVVDLLSSVSEAQLDRVLAQAQASDA